MYVNRQKGYKLAYPGGWSVSERTNKAGYQVTTLEPAKSGNAISIKAVPSNRAIAEKPRQPNAICHPVAVNGVHGQQCTVTTSFTTTTSLASGETTYLITTEGKGARNEVYDQVVSSFRIQDEARK